MAYAGYGQTLLGRGGGEQGTRAAEEDAFELSAPELVQQFTAEGDGAAPAARSSGMDILHCIVKDHAAAVCDLSSQGKIVPFSKLQEDVLAHLSQIPCDDQIKIIGGSAKILHMTLYGFECGGGRCQG